jgi:hypothetical protein
LTGPDLNKIASILAEKLVCQPRWLKLKAAAVYSGIGQKELIKLAHKRKIDGFQDLELKTRPWLFDRISIDKYRTSQIEQYHSADADEEIALDIVGSLNI